MQIGRVIDWGAALRVLLEGGAELGVPKDQANGDYRDVLAWQQAGGTIEPVPDPGAEVPQVVTKSHRTS